MRIYTRILSVAMVLMLVLSMLPLSFVSAATVVPRAVQLQWTNEWKDDYYGTTYRGNLYDTGCGIFSTVNAVGYLTGNEMSVTEVADWAYEIKALNYFAGGVDRTIMYPKLEAKFGKDYGFTVGEALWAKATTPSLLTHLQNGGVAIGHVYGHFIAIVGYDASTGYFHVYDSAPSSSRGTGSGDAWVSTSWITTSTYFTVDWFCPLTRTGTVINRDYGQTGETEIGTSADKLGTYQISTETLNVRAGASVDYDIVTTVKQGDIVKVTELSNGWGKFTAPDGKEGWANVTNYGTYIGVDALAYEQSAATTGLTSTIDNQGRMTLTNTSSALGMYDLYLPHKLGTLTTPCMSLQMTPIYGNGYYFGITQKNSAYWMMRDCNSGDQLVNETSAPFMTGTETLEINLADWWKPSQGYQVDHVRVYVAPYSSIRVNYFYFTQTAGTVKDMSYNLRVAQTEPTNINLMRPDALDIDDRSKTGGYSYQNGVLTVTSNDDNGYSVVFDVNQSFNVYEFMYWLLSFKADAPFNISLLVTHANGESWASLATDYFDQFGETYPVSGYLPAKSGTSALGLYGFYSYNGFIPSDGISTVKKVKVSLGSKGSITVDGLQLSENQELVVFADAVSKSDSSVGAKVEFETDTYVVDNGFVSGVEIGTTLSTLLQNIRSDYTVTVYEKDAVVSGSTVAKTGQVVKVMNGTTELQSYELVVFGDVNGDGASNTMDARVIIKSLVNVALDGSQKLAADVNDDDIVNSNDVRSMMAALVG